MLREDLAGKTVGAHGPRKHHNHVFEWTVGDKDLTDAAFRKAEVSIKEMISYHRIHPSPLETCQCVCSFDKIRGELTIWGTFQAPHVIRTVVALIAKPARAEDPRDLARHRRRLRQQGRRLSRLYLRGGRLDRHRQAGEMGRGPHREPDRDLVCPRLPHDDGDRRDQGRQGHRAARPCAGRPRRLRRLRRPVEMAGRLLQHRHRVLRFPDRPSRRRRHLHQQGAGRRRLSLLVPGDRGGLLHRAGDGHPGAETRHGPGRAAAEEFHQARAVPLPFGARLGI